MRYGSVQNAEIHLFCSENRNFFKKSRYRRSFRPLPGRHAVRSSKTMKRLFFFRKPLFLIFVFSKRDSFHTHMKSSQSNVYEPEPATALFRSRTTAKETESTSTMHNTRRNLSCRMPTIPAGHLLRPLRNRTPYPSRFIKSETATSPYHPSR